MYTLYTSCNRWSDLVFDRLMIDDPKSTRRKKRFGSICGAIPAASLGEGGYILQDAVEMPDIIVELGSLHVSVDRVTAAGRKPCTATPIFLLLLITEQQTLTPTETGVIRGRGVVPSLQELLHDELTLLKLCAHHASTCTKIRKKPL